MVLPRGGVEKAQQRLHAFDVLWYWKLSKQAESRKIDFFLIVSLVILAKAPKIGTLLTSGISAAAAGQISSKADPETAAVVNNDEAFRGSMHLISPLPDIIRCNVRDDNKKDRFSHSVSGE